MSARIYQKPQNAMQSGKAHTDEWVLEFEPSEPRHLDPLTGWVGSGDTQTQVKLTFESREAALAYAKRYGIEARVIPPRPHRLHLKSYADNFR